MKSNATKLLLFYIIFSFAFLILHCSQSTGSGESNLYEKDTTAINLTETHQLIRGFGAANIVPWRPDMTADEIETAFGTDEGQIGFSLLRLRVPYTQDEFALNVPTAKAAYDMGIQIIASPWTPPVWMKTDIPDTSNPLAGGHLNDTSYVSYANHLKAFADYMENNGVPLYAISIQNEPDVTVTYESCDWDADQMVRFIKENAPSIGKKIIAPESATFNRTISDAILNDPVAVNNIDIIGGHIYGHPAANYPLAINKGKEVWMTEHLTESYHSANIWSLALEVGVEMQQVMQANMNAYIWWYIVRYYGPIGDGEVSSRFPDEEFAAKGEVTKKGYVMSQFARFIRPGYTRVGATYNPADGIYVTAYTGNNRVVIVVVNSLGSDTELDIEIHNGNVSNFTPYTTSEKMNCEKQPDVLVTGGSFQYNINKNTVTTFVSD